MLKVSHAGDHHGKIIFLAVPDRIFVADGTAGLDEGGDACLMAHLYTVVERKKGVGGEYRPGEINAELPGFLDRLPERVDPAGLSATLSDQLFIFYQRNGVGFKVFAYEVSKYKIVPLLFPRLPPAG